MSHFDEEDEQDLAPPPADWAQQLLHFWFKDHGQSHWFGGGPEFDEEIRSLAGDWWRVLRMQPAASFLSDEQTALAALILFDQVPRNIHRGSADAFASDELAKAIAHGVVERQWDQRWDKYQRLFAYLPYEHSEELDDQRESMRLIAQLGDADLLGYAQKHYDIVAKFGRFPHRNKVLGRKIRPEEAEAIEAGKNW